MSKKKEEINKEWELLQYFVLRSFYCSVHINAMNFTHVYFIKEEKYVYLFPIWFSPHNKEPSVSFFFYYSCKQTDTVYYTAKQCFKLLIMLRCGLKKLSNEKCSNHCILWFIIRFNKICCWNKGLKLFYFLIHLLHQLLYCYLYRRRRNTTNYFATWSRYYGIA